MLGPRDVDQSGLKFCQHHPRHEIRHQGGSCRWRPRDRARRGVRHACRRSLWRSPQWQKLQDDGYRHADHQRRQDRQDLPHGKLAQCNWAATRQVIAAVDFFGNTKAGGDAGITAVFVNLSRAGATSSHAAPSSAGSCNSHAYQGYSLCRIVGRETDRPLHYKVVSEGHLFSTGFIVPFIKLGGVTISETSVDTLSCKSPAQPQSQDNFVLPAETESASRASADERTCTGASVLSSVHAQRV